MNSLINNACWQEECGCAPKYFALEGPITYDAFCLGGFRTCSVTMCGGDCPCARCCYQNSICVRGRKQITWGFLLRTIDACCIRLLVDFYDKAGCHVTCKRESIEECVGHEFTRKMCCFDVPRTAVSAKLSIEFEGRVTACTFCAPSAHF